MESKKNKTYILHLPEEAHTTIKAFAVLKNITMNAYILNAVHKQLIEDQKRQ